MAGIAKEKYQSKASEGLCGVDVTLSAPRVSKTLGNIIKMVLLLCGLDFGPIVILGRWVKYPLLPHRTRGGTSNGILGYRLSRHVRTRLLLAS